MITLDSDDENLNNNESKLEKEGIIAVIPAKKDENYVKVSLITKKGIIKEYIQEDDLGIIISDDGIILFHSNQLYHDGIQGEFNIPALPFLFQGSFHLFSRFFSAFPFGYTSLLYLRRREE